MPYQGSGFPVRSYATRYKKIYTTCRKRSNLEFLWLTPSVLTSWLCADQLALILVKN